MLTDKKLSILGDSISTYKGVSNDAAANSSTRYNPYFYAEPFPLEKTYWMRLMQAFGMQLCVNNSWSGGNLSGTYDPDSGVNRACQLARDNGEMPDYIIVFMGLNDFGRYVPLNAFALDYARTLQIIKDTYPNAKTCCVNLPHLYPKWKAEELAFNQAISNAVANAGENFFIADLFHSELHTDVYYNNTLDGLHPDEDGARMIAEVVIDAFKKFVN